MASLADLSGIYNQAPPTGFSLANIQLAGDLGQAQADVGRERILRNFNQFDLPDMISGQAARGALVSSATNNKRARLATGSADRLGDIQMALAQQQANLAANGLLAQTGIRLGGV